MLKGRGANSTRTPFLHREGRVETGGGDGFNREARGVDSERENDEVRMTNDEVKNVLERIL